MLASILSMPIDVRIDSIDADRCPSTPIDAHGRPSMPIDAHRCPSAPIDAHRCQHPFYRWSSMPIEAPMSWGGFKKLHRMAGVQLVAAAMVQPESEQPPFRSRQEEGSPLRTHWRWIVSVVASPAPGSCCSSGTAGAQHALRRRGLVGRVSRRLPPLRLQELRIMSRLTAAGCRGRRRRQSH